MRYDPFGEELETSVLMSKPHEENRCGQPIQTQGEKCPTRDPELSLPLFSRKVGMGFGGFSGTLRYRNLSENEKAPTAPTRETITGKVVVMP